MTRDEAITVLEDIIMFESFGNKATCDACKLAIEALEQPDQKQGKWEEDEPYWDGIDECKVWKCSNCTAKSYKNSPYCPNCGKKMEGKQ